MPRVIWRNRGPDLGFEQDRLFLSWLSNILQTVVSLLERVTVASQNVADDRQSCLRRCHKRAGSILQNLQ